MGRKMNRDEIFDKIKGTLEEKGFDVSNMTMESSFSDDLGLDSLDQTEFILAVEDFIGQEIDDETAQGLTTAGKLIDYIEEVAG